MTGVWRIGVCSWSLEPRDVDSLAERALAAGVTAIQLALDPIRSGRMGVEEVRRRLGDAGLTLVSGMMAMEGEDYSTLGSIRETGGIAPDATWPANRRAARDLARIAGELGLGLVTFHAGFLPEDSRDPRFELLGGRIREVAGLFLERGVQVALETGQESAAAMARVLDPLTRERVGVNFDPGNMILYGSGDPVSALRLLAPRVLQAHMKDALPSLSAEAWGSEVPLGQGAVDWGALLGALRGCPEVATLVIEREAGPERLQDIIRARQFLESVIE